MSCSNRVFAIILLCAIPVQAAVQIYVEQGNGIALLKYDCTAGEVVRAFALDVTVDKGQIVGVSDFFRGESTTVARGYGIFPAAFRDAIQIGPGTNVDWQVPAYTPLADASDAPGDTLPGLDSSGVTLAFAALWDSSQPDAAPPPTGTLCALQITQGANVSVAANQSRGGVAAANPDKVLAPVFSGGFVQPPEITGFSVSNNIVAITFAGGELETAPSLEGPWTITGDTSGKHTEPVSNTSNRFYRVGTP